jgi:hypothetical protein
MYAASWIRTHYPSNQAAKTYVLDSAASGTGMKNIVYVWRHKDFIWLSLLPNDAKSE